MTREEALCLIRGSVVYETIDGGGAPARVMWVSDDGTSFYPINHVFP